MSGDNCKYCTSDHLSFYSISIKQVNSITYSFGFEDRLSFSGWFIFDFREAVPKQIVIIESSDPCSLHICLTCRFVNRDLIGKFSCQHEIVINCREKKLTHKGLVFKEGYEVISKVEDCCYKRDFKFKTKDKITYHIDLETNSIEEGFTIPKLKLTDYSEDFIYKSPIHSPNTTIYDYLKEENNKTVVDKAIEFVFGNNVESLKETSTSTSIEQGTVVRSKKRSSNEL